MFPPHPTSASALPAKSRTSEICVEMHEKKMLLRNVDKSKK